MFVNKEPIISNIVTKNKYRMAVDYRILKYILENMSHGIPNV